METKNIMIVGVGGQGTLLTSRVLGGIIQAAGYSYAMAIKYMSQSSKKGRQTFLLPLKN